MSANHKLSTQLARVNSIIAQSLHSDVSIIKDIGNHLVNSGGKRLRPLLVLGSAQVFGKVNKKHSQLAAAVELLHTATLLHDDVIDNSSLRRGKLTANNNWDNSSSVLSGDFLYARSLELAAKLKNWRVVHLLIASTCSLVEGEVTQLNNKNKNTTSESDYFLTIEKKTASLFAAASAGAAVISSQKEDVVNKCFEFGKSFGIAFQLVDDLLDYTANPKDSGKQVGNDFIENKITLPMLYTLKVASSKDKQLIFNYLQKRRKITPAELTQIIELMDKLGAFDYVRDIVRKKIKCTQKILAKFDPKQQGLLINNTLQDLLHRIS